MTLWRDESAAAAVARFCLVAHVSVSRCVATVPAFASEFGLSPADSETLHSDLGAHLPTSWRDVSRRSRLGLPVRLNLGGGWDHHPVAHYWDFIAVGRPDLEQNDRGDDSVSDDSNAPTDRSAFSVTHNLLAAMPLADDTVDEILSEHCLEHLELRHWDTVLREAHRVLKPGGILRFAVPDYGAPAHAAHLAAEFDADEANHLVLPTLDLLERVFEDLPFRRAHFREYWCVRKTTPSSKAPCTFDSIPRLSTGVCRRGGSFVAEGIEETFRAATAHVKRSSHLLLSQHNWQSGVGDSYRRVDAQTGFPVFSSLVVDVYK